MSAEKDWDALVEQFAELGFDLERPPKWKYVLWWRDSVGDVVSFMDGFTSLAEARAKLKSLKDEDGLEQEVDDGQ